MVWLLYEVLIFGVVYFDVMWCGIVCVAKLWCGVIANGLECEISLRVCQLWWDCVYECLYGMVGVLYGKNYANGMPIKLWCMKNSATFLIRSAGTILAEDCFGK